MGISVTLLCENTVRRRGLLGEHGLAYWIEDGDARILFDTGQGASLQHNARTLGINLASATHIVLSHGHYDHTGGLETALLAAPTATLFLHPDACQPKFTRNPDGSTRPVGSPFLIERRHESLPNPIVQMSTPTQLTPQLLCTGPIPRTNDFEDVGGAFFLDESSRSPDPLLDDVALLATHGNSQSLLCGCCHSGLVNTLDFSHSLLPGKPINTILGGLHLLHASRSRLEQTTRHLQSLNPTRIGFCHCTGFHAGLHIGTAFPNAVVDFHCGSSLHLPL